MSQTIYYGVTKFKEGDRVGVGVIIGWNTYNSSSSDGTRNQGGYSDKIVVDQRFVVSFPDGLPSDAGAPLLCAGITVYSPMKYYGMTEEKGKHLGVSGLGGLGHIAVKIGKAFDLKVTVIIMSSEKEREKRLIDSVLTRFSSLLYGYSKDEGCNWDNGFRDGYGISRTFSVTVVEFA